MMNNINCFGKKYLNLLIDVNEAQLPGRHKTARRYDNGESSGDFANSPKSYYRQVYYEATDCNLIALTWLMHIPSLSTVRRPCLIL